jgi:hypothetical protein
MKEGGYLCIAGWDPESKQMVRPLPDGRHWDPRIVVTQKIVPGVTIHVLPVGNSTRDYPHRTEDQPITLNSITVVQRGFTEWFGPDAPKIAKSISEAFEGNVLRNSEYQGVAQGAHILPGTKCASLAAVKVQRDFFSFVEDFGKLKCLVDDGKRRYKLSVTSKALRDAWGTGGLSAASAALPRRASLHVRIGLAHAYDNPPKCYMMLNGAL